MQKNMAHTITTDDSKCVVIGASIGRDPKNPSDRKVGNSNLEQRLEINENGTSNTITSVQKDKYAVELPEYRTASSAWSSPPSGSFSIFPFLSVAHK